MKKVMFEEELEIVKLNNITPNDFILYKDVKGHYFTIGMVNENTYCELMLDIFNICKNFAGWGTTLQQLSNKSIQWMYSFETFKEMIEFLRKELNKEG